MENSEEKIDFETKIENASKLLEKLTSKDITLSDSVKVYKDGLKELEDASKLLEEAKLEFETIS